MRWSAQTNIHPVSPLLGSSLYVWLTYHYSEYDLKLAGPWLEPATNIFERFSQAKEISLLFAAYDALHIEHYQ